MGLYDQKLGAAIYDAGGEVVHLANPKYGWTAGSTTPADSAITSALADCATSTDAMDTLRFPPGETVYVDAVTLDRPVRLDLRGCTLVKSSCTVDHMFTSVDGNAPSVEIVGGHVRLTKGAFSSGQTVSALFGVRLNDVVVRGTAFSSGIEEGLKLYNPRRVWLEDVEFRDFANDGAQIVTQSSSADGYTGSTSRAATEDCELVVLRGVRCYDMSDGSAGEGQGVAMGSPSGDAVIRNVLVEDYYARNCYRGLWWENNQAGQQTANVAVRGVVIEDFITYGVGFVGVDAGVIDDYIITQTSSAAAGSTTGEIAGIVVTGSTPTPSRDITVGHGTIQGTTLTDYGLLIRQTCGITHRGTARIEGCARDIGSNLWASVEGAVVHGPDPVCIVEQSTSTTVANATWTNMQWGERVHDPNGWASSGPGSVNITPTYPGRYGVTIGESWGTNANGSRGIRIYENNGANILRREHRAPATTDDDTSFSVAAVVEIDPDSTGYIFAQRIQTSGGSLAPSTAQRVSMTVRWIGGTT